MENESSALDVLAVGESMSIDYGLLIAINSTSNTNCTMRFKNGCSPREKLHFRFWPGEFNPSQTSQGVMALSVMLILLCLVFTYCCWGTCCKLIQKRSRNRRSRSQISFESNGSFPSDPRLMMMWSQNHRHDLCAHHQESIREQQQRNNFLLKPVRLLRPEVPPPPYDVLFGQEINCAPPTYSSLALNQAIATCPIAVSPENYGAPLPTASFVAVVIERQSEPPSSSDDARESRIHGNSSSSAENPKHTANRFYLEPQEENSEVIS